jgi:hypothetical protein
MADKKKEELTVNGEELAEQDPAVQANVPQEPPTSELEGQTAQEVHGDRLPEEVKEAGIGLGFTSGHDERGTPMGIRGEQEDFRGSSLKFGKGGSQA